VGRDPLNVSIVSRMIRNGEDSAMQMRSAEVSEGRVGSGQYSPCGTLTESRGGRTASTRNSTGGSVKIPTGLVAGRYDTR